MTTPPPRPTAPACTNSRSSRTRKPWPSGRTSRSPSFAVPGPNTRRSSCILRRRWLRLGDCSFFGGPVEPKPLLSEHLGDEQFCFRLLTPVPQTRRQGGPALLWRAVQVFLQVIDKPRLS